MTPVDTFGRFQFPTTSGGLLLTQRTPKKIGNMLNSPCFAVTIAHHTTCLQSYPQKLGTNGGIFTALLLSCVFLCEDGGGSVFASGSWMATSKEFLLPDSTVTYRGFLVGCAQKKAYQRSMNPTFYNRYWRQDDPPLA